MITTSQPTKIPVFLHVPKSAGSYVIHVLTNYFNRLCGDRKSMHMQRLTVTGENYNLTIFVRFRTDYWKTDKNITDHHIRAPRAKMTGLSTLRTYIESDRLDILSIVIEPVSGEWRPSFSLVHQIINMCKSSGVYFTIAREPFSRHQSLYHYLTGEESSHEPTHGCIKQQLFIEYLNSESLADSWSIRKVTGMQSLWQITEFWFNMACNLFDSLEFKIKNIKETDILIDEVLQECFDSPVISSDRGNNIRNSTNTKNKITIDDLDDATRSKFEARTHWDRKLYERYCK